MLDNTNLAYIYIEQISLLSQFNWDEQILQVSLFLYQFSEEIFFSKKNISIIAHRSSVSKSINFHDMVPKYNDLNKL